MTYQIKYWLTCLLLFCFSFPIDVFSQYSDTIYINPEFSGEGKGTIEQPFHSWKDISKFQNNTFYAQKRGTKCIINGTIDIYHGSFVKFGTYDEGNNYATIQNLSTGNDKTICINSSNHCTVEGFSLTGTYQTTCGILISDDWQPSEFKGNCTAISNCNIETFCWGIRMIKYGNSPFDTVMVNNVHIHNIYQDGMFIQGWGDEPLRKVSITNCNIDSVNQSYQPGIDESIAEGDGIQISRTVDQWIIKDCIIDRRNSSNKFCIIDNDESGTNKCRGTIEGCILYAPDTGFGGLACYFSGLKSIDFKNNRVYGNNLSRTIMTRWGTECHCAVNIFSKSGESSPEVVFDLGAGPNYIHNNTFYGASKVFHFTSGYDETEVINNIFHSAGTVYEDWVETQKDYNLYFNSTVDENEPHSIYYKDPLFIDPKNDDFNLKEGSPAIDNGSNLGYTSDLSGNTLPKGNGYDFGALEYVAPSGNDRMTENQKILIYPNPAKDDITVITANPGVLRLVGLDGRTIRYWNISTGKNFIKINEFRGYFLIKFTSQFNQESLSKLVIP